MVYFSLNILRERQVGWSSFRDHPHIWGTDELMHKHLLGVFAPEVIQIEKQ